MSGCPVDLHHFPCECDPAFDHAEAAFLINSVLALVEGVGYIAAGRLGTLADWHAARARELATAASDVVCVCLYCATSHKEGPCALRDENGDLYPDEE